MSDELRAERLAVDIDTRLSELWAIVWADEHPLSAVLANEDTRDSFAAALRAAYGQGYTDSLREVRAGRPGALATDNGYRMVP